MNIEEIRCNLIDKVISIKDDNLLKQIDSLIGNIQLDETVFKINNSQRLMLEKSDRDIEGNNTMADDELNKEEEEWLNG